MFYQLPPVGNPISLRCECQAQSALEELFFPYRQHYYESGTGALAAAITAAIRLKGVDHPEVLIPAYGCPDLVSAAVHAGAAPVLVDLEFERPWMDLSQLRSRISSRTVAIIAVSLFGISERMVELGSLAQEAGAVLIEDSAQAFPLSGESDVWKGDLIVLSFGRGKPVSLLGGGAVLFRESALGDLLPTPEAQPRGKFGGNATFRLKLRLYNQVISPRFYWLPQSLPFLHLGETRYDPLTDIESMDPERLSLLPANIVIYQKGDNGVQEALAEMLEKLNANTAKLIDLPTICRVPKKRRLLRYPLLVATSIRDRLYQKCKRSGVGPSTMYPAALPGVPGLGELLAGQGPFPSAESFAKRILTLPVHNGVKAGDIAKMRKVLHSI